jgi:hypothetical protein
MSDRKPKAFEIILEGFDGRTDTTDDLIIWVKAPTEAHVRTFTKSPRFQAAHPEGVRNIIPMGKECDHYTREHGIDYVL